MPNSVLDTGSPISFISHSVFKSHFDSFNDLKNTVNTNKALNNTPIKIAGSIVANIKLELLPDLSPDINLHVLMDDSLSIDLIIGRDFLENHKINVLYKPSENITDNRLSLFIELASTDIIEDTETPQSEITTDFGESVTKRLLTLIGEIEELDVPPAEEDEYLVQFELKDDSIYACTPRRFSWAERIQLCKITDDLLKRGII